MSIFDVLTMFGGLAMFLYGMRIMGDGLKSSSSGSMKKMIETLTNTPLKGFMLGLLMTAVIQSSTATIVITAGLVAAGIMSFHNSVGILVGANVGTTVTGQIIRLMDLNSSSTAWLQFFKPSSLAPIALILGIVFIMFMKFRNSDIVGQVAMGFGILFTGLMTMSNAVTNLSDSGVFEIAFSSMGSNPFLAYGVGLVVSFILQSSSATVGILQAISTSGCITFASLYATLGGIYLGDCVTTALVIWIGAKPDAKRVALVNIIYNLAKTALVIVAVGIGKSMGLLDGLWNAPLNSGGIANVNTVFNLACAFMLFPTIRALEKLTVKFVKDEPVARGKYDDKLAALNPNFFKTPMFAFGACFDILSQMLTSAQENISKAFDSLYDFDYKVAEEVEKEEDNIDHMTDRVNNYLVQLSGHIKTEDHTAIMDEYLKAATEFERLGDHATNILEVAQELDKDGSKFSEDALGELTVLRELIGKILDYTKTAFEKNDVEAAEHIEPLEEVVDDMIEVLKDNHITRLKNGECSVMVGTRFLNMLVDIERISDVCSDVGISVITKMKPELGLEAHTYASLLHDGNNETFNSEYQAAHDEYFGRLLAIGK